MEYGKFIVSYCKYLPPTREGKQTDHKEVPKRLNSFTLVIVYVSVWKSTITNRNLISNE